MSKRTYESRVLQMLGEPREADADMRAFRKNAQVLSSRRQQLIRRYPDQWVGIFGGEVVAHGNSADVVVEQLRKLGIPGGRAIVRFISRHPRKMFL